jgi:hypothetical protein
MFYDDAYNDRRWPCRGSLVLLAPALPDPGSSEGPPSTAIGTPCVGFARHWHDWRGGCGRRTQDRLKINVEKTHSCSEVWQEPRGPSPASQSKSTGWRGTCGGPVRLGQVAAAAV